MFSELFQPEVSVCVKVLPVASHSHGKYKYNFGSTKNTMPLYCALDSSTREDV